ncbi:MAG: hypothetical protein ABJ205_08290 [Erythrobacter sp.]|uniref:hypothetical protein n=1 Tax=Erythrobacter sp. TaxID=1042 RepID=UPI00326339D9
MSIPKHRAFVPMVTIWGGLLLALMTAVMPDQPIARVSSLTGVYLPLLLTRIILSVGIGLAGALLGYIVASALSNRAKMMGGDGILVSAFKSRELQPINPAYDLGSDSLDAPLDTPSSRNEAEPAEFAEMDDASGELETSSEGDGVQTPLLGELAKRGYEMEPPEGFDGDDGKHKNGEWAFTRKHFKEALIESCEGATCEAANGAETASQPSVSQAQSFQAHAKKPRVLDLDEFASLPRRNGVWVEDQSEASTSEGDLPQNAVQATPEPSPAPEQITANDENLPENALDKLRQKPPENLSLVEMVERFAGALHDHQTQARARVADNDIAREAALAEALKALALFTEHGFNQGAPTKPNDNVLGRTEEELRSALAHLQDLRGAA